MVWSIKQKSSKIWILLGFIGVGQLVALIYSLVSKKDSDRVFGVLFILGWLGDIIIYFIEKDKDKHLSSMALYLLFGEILLIVIVIFVSVFMYSTGIFTPYSAVTTEHSSGFNPFLVTTAVCNSSSLTAYFYVGQLPYGANSTTLNNMSLSFLTGMSGKNGVTAIPSPATVASGDIFNVAFSGVRCSTSGAFFSATGKISYSVPTASGPKTYTAVGTIAGTSS